MSRGFSEPYAGAGEAYRSGLTAVIPFVAGTIPFGLVTGVATCRNCRIRCRSRET